MFFSRWFSLGLWIDFGANLTPTLSLCWELFRAFLALTLRSYLEGLFASIFDQFWTPLEHQKLSSRLGENQKNEILRFLSQARFGGPYRSPKGFQKRSQDTPKYVQNLTGNLFEVKRRFCAQLGPTWGPSWAQLGPQEASKIEEKG